MRSLRGLGTGRQVLERDSGTWQVERFWEDLGGEQDREGSQVVAHLRALSLQCLMKVFDPILNSPPAPLSCPHKLDLFLLWLKGLWSYQLPGSGKATYARYSINMNVITFFVFGRREHFPAPNFSDIKDAFFTLCHILVSQAHNKRLWGTASWGWRDRPSLSQSQNPT